MYTLDDLSKNQLKAMQAIAANDSTASLEIWSALYNMDLVDITTDEHGNTIDFLTPAGRALLDASTPPAPAADVAAGGLDASFERDVIEEMDRYSNQLIDENYQLTQDLAQTRQQLVEARAFIQQLAGYKSQMTMTNYHHGKEAAYREIAKQSQQFLDGSK